jgi:hypothetical protein
MPADNHIFTTAHIEAFARVEHYLHDAIAYSDAYGGPIADGTQFSPSDRAIPYVESVYQDSSDTEWEHFDWALTDLYDSLDLVWADGMLWRAGDLPEEL